MEGRLTRTAGVALLLATVLTMSACSSSDDNLADVPSSTVPTSSAAVDGGTSDRRVVAEIDDVEVRGQADYIDRDKRLTISEGHATLPDSEARVASTDVVSIRMDGGNTQPSAPVTVEFDLSGRPDLVAQITDDVVPVVETASEADPNELDMFVAEWDPKTETVTAQLPHLTNVWLSIFDLKKVATNILKVFENVQGTIDSPCRERSEITLGGVEYTLTARDPGDVAACLVGTGGTLAVDLENVTGSFYSIVVTPDTAGGIWTHSGAMGLSTAAGSLFSGVVLGSKGVLAGRSEGRLVMNAGVDGFEIRLLPQQQGILAQSLLSGVSMLGVSPDQLDKLTGFWDCVTTNVSVDDVYGTVTDIGQCVSNLPGGKRLGVAFQILAMSRQLTDLITGALEDFTGNAVKTFQVRSARPTTAAPTPTPTTTAPQQTFVDRVELTTWAYDRVEGHTYVADNINQKMVYLYVNSFAGDKEIRRGCSTTLSVTGPAFSFNDTSQGCYVGNPGTTFKAPAPGKYTATATVSQVSRPDIVSEVVVNILPYGS